jgi:hypothetical protein
MRYSKIETISGLEQALEPVDSLYNSPCVNRKGMTADTNEYYTEVIAAELLLPAAMKKLSEIKQINRANYRVSSHEKITLTKTNRGEENFAKGLFSVEMEKLGNIIDYQVPLKQVNSDKAGKIDLIARRSNSASIIEVKYLGNKDTLLKSALEIWTYYHQLNKQNFITSYEELGGIEGKNIKKTVLAGQGCRTYQEAKELKDGCRPNLRKLIEKLNINIMLFKYDTEQIL